MNILGISGTPRKGGNSEILLDAALEPFVEAKWDVTKILLSEKRIEPCVGCDTCVEQKTCCINDDMAEIYRAYEKCDAIIISAPAYWRNVPAQLKAVIDRTYGNKNGSLKGKLGGAIAVGRGQGGGQAIVINAIYNFYLSSGALCVPAETNGVTAVADKPGDILSQPRRLEQARILGRNIMSYARM
ncbi:MAG: flavodoxin family protein [Oscillospiraceae bacterium]|nr:flavodoxin family protein [Oscillospiraceae bacterium]